MQSQYYYTPCLPRHVNHTQTVWYLVNSKDFILLEYLFSYFPYFMKETAPATRLFTILNFYIA